MFETYGQCTGLGLEQEGGESDVESSGNEGEVDRAHDQTKPKQTKRKRTKNTCPDTVDSENEGIGVINQPQTNHRTGVMNQSQHDSNVIRGP